MKDTPRRVVIGISGASGVILGLRVLEVLHGQPVETHLVLSPAAHAIIQQETSYTVAQVQALAHTVHRPTDLTAPIASGSYPTQGMVIIPCSIKTLSAVANSYASNLLTRAADVTLKEGRPLVLVVRETPLHPGHLRLMSLAARAGAVIFPPVPAFYTRPASLDDLINQIVGRVLSRVGIETGLYQQWGE